MTKYIPAADIWNDAVLLVCIIDCGPYELIVPHCNELTVEFVKDAGEYKFAVQPAPE